MITIRSSWNVSIILDIHYVYSTGVLFEVSSTFTCYTNFRPIGIDLGSGHTHTHIHTHNDLSLGYSSAQRLRLASMKETYDVIITLGCVTALLSG